MMELRIRHVSKTYPNGVQALRDITLTIPPGVCGVLGPAGAGKSTLMRILATQQEPDAGTIHLGGIDLVRQKQKANKRLAYLPQDFIVQTKASMERLLAGRPKLVVLDEPTVGLEPSQRARLARLSRELAESSVIVLATKRLEDVTDLCTRLAILHDGRILLDAQPARAIGELCGRIWHRVISREALPRVEREYWVVSAKPVDLGIAVRVYSHTAPAVGFERADPDLEDVYLCALRFAAAGAHARPSAPLAQMDVLPTSA